MITLRPMTTDEFSSFCTYFIADYADEIGANFGHSPEQSRLIASKELAEDLPQNIATPHNHLLCIEQNENTTVGYLWYKLFDEGTTAFVLDFVVFKEFRRQGYGKSALLALEKQLFDSGTKQIKLRVAYKNDKARQLYEKVGFNITGFNMSKLLGSHDD
jgi:ribosomal protein S18 acetylase RimI-like enzyme